MATSKDAVLQEGTLEQVRQCLSVSVIAIAFIPSIALYYPGASVSH